MKTIRFKHWDRVGYTCSEPGDQDGEYVRAEVAKALLAACEDWLYYAENALPEFTSVGDMECDENEPLCPPCEVAGCIQRKIRNARAAIAKAKECQ